MDQDIFEFAIINAIATLPEPENLPARELAAAIFVETHSTEQIKNMITRLKVFDVSKTLIRPDNESSRCVKMFIDSIRQKASRSIKID